MIKEKKKVTSAESFAGDLYLILVGNDYKVISIVGEKYLSSKTYILIPPNDQAEPEYITIANNTYKLYGDGTVKVVGEMTTNSGITDEEKDIVRRGRNAQNHHLPKNASIEEYSYSTGFEALIGFLYLNKRDERLSEILEECIRIVSNELTSR